jgi:hypothetical protein
MRRNSSFLPLNLFSDQHPNPLVISSAQQFASERSSVTFAEFWPAYVRAHSKPATRVVHCIGTIAGWMLLGGAMAERRWWWVAAAIVASYTLAWLAHFFLEHNKPATFDHPLWSWWADQKMVFLMLIGRMDAEVRKCAAAEHWQQQPWGRA